jgi:predicted branched-subunit amino acid permease
LTDIPQSDRKRILRQAVSIALAVMPFGLAFGIAAREAGLSIYEAMGFSSLVFTGSAQFAAVSVLSDGGSALTAVLAGALLNLRSLAFGVALAPVLKGSRRFRAIAAQLMIDEAAAVGMAQDEPAQRRFGYLAGGLAVFALWNLSTAAGVLFLGALGDIVTQAGIDATIPAAFLALLWPRLSDSRQRAIALGGAFIALASVPLLPPGLPIVAAGLAVALPRRKGRP